MSSSTDGNFREALSTLPGLCVSLLRPNCHPGIPAPAEPVTEHIVYFFRDVHGIYPITPQALA
jgi:hypothetical protein